MKHVALPQWEVVLHDDDFNTLSYVVTCLLNVLPDLTEERASEMANEVEAQGRSTVVTCPLELAEMYREQLEELVLTATIERA